MMVSIYRVLTLFANRKEDSRRSFLEVRDGVGLMVLLFTLIFEGCITHRELHAWWGSGARVSV